MYDLSAATLLVNIAITWTIGLIPPVLIRYAIFKRPIAKWPAIGTCALFYFGNIILFMALGSESKTHGALLLVAFVSYWILRQGVSMEGEREKAVAATEKTVPAPSPRMFARSRRHWSWTGPVVMKWIPALSAGAMALSLIFPPWEISGYRGVSTRTGYGTLLGPRDKQVRPMIQVCLQADEALAAAEAYPAALAEYEASGEAARDRLANAAMRREAEGKGEFIIGGGDGRRYTSSGLEGARQHAATLAKDCESKLTELKSRAGIDFSVLLTQLVAIAGLALATWLFSRVMVARGRSKSDH